MRIDVVLPLLLAAGFVALGIIVIADALVGDPGSPGEERRRTARAERHQVGELLLGTGLLLAAGVLAGGERWLFSNVLAVGAAVLIAVGAALNWRYLAEFVMHRGSARRRS